MVWCVCGMVCECGVCVLWSVFVCVWCVWGVCLGSVWCVCVSGVYEPVVCVCSVCVIWVYVCVYMWGLDMYGVCVCMGVCVRFVCVVV